MVLGIGLDVVDVPRFGSVLARHGARFERRVFVPEELAACARRADRVRALAARFAAKEACLKALGTGWSEGLGFSQVEVRNEPSGRPALRLHGRAAEEAAGRGVTRIHLSLTHDGELAAAMVVLEG